MTQSPIQGRGHRAVGREGTVMRTIRTRILDARSWPAISLLVAAGCCALFVATARTKTDPDSCGPATAHTIVADSAARIYRIPAGNSLEKLYAYYGCTFVQGKPVRLTSEQGGPFTYVHGIRLNGAVAGLIVDRHGVDTGSSTLTILDLQDRRVLHTVTTSYMAPRFDDVLVAYVMTAAGNTAWSVDSSLEAPRESSRSTARSDTRPSSSIRVPRSAPAHCDCTATPWVGSTEPSGDTHRCRSVTLSAQR